MNTLYKPEQDKNTEEIYRNVTQFCWVGVSEDPKAPKNQVPVAGNLSVPPGRAVKRLGGALTSAVTHNIYAVTVFRGPAEPMQKELEALKANGVVPVLDEVQEPGFISGHFTGKLSAVLHNVTADVKSASTGLLEDPDQVLAMSKMQSELAALRAESTSLRTENEKLKTTKAKVIPKQE